MTMAIDIQLEHYSLEAEISRNDHFTLYQGRDKASEIAVTLKVVAPLYAGDEFFVRRFKQMAEHVARLDHPNILHTCAARQEDDWLYIVQDHTESRSLAQIIEDEGPLSPHRMQFIAGQIASALDYAHQRSITHGDMSARQIYLGANDHVLIADFGQSQAVFGANLAKNAHAVASPETLAPERVYGQGPSRQADLYALGILCYHMLTKTPPFTGPTSAVLHAQAHKQPLPIHLANPVITIGVSKVIGRMLSKGVELRYNTGAEFIRALAMAKHATKPSPRPFEALTPLSERSQRQPLSFKTIFYIGSAMIIMIFIAVLFAWAGYELGVRRADEETTTVRIVAAATIVALQSASSEQQAVSTEPEISPYQPLPTASPTEVSATLQETLLPTPGPLIDTISSGAIPSSSAITSPIDIIAAVDVGSTVVTPPAPAPIPTTLPSQPTSTSNPSPVPQPIVPAGQTLFFFSNPTGHDLIIDLSGPTSTSALVPPNEQHEFQLAPGRYQVIVHTITGAWLDTIVANFELAEGQLVEKDYYSDYDRGP